METGGQIPTVPSLYIMCGLPFAGKTTVALALVRQVGFRRVAIDDINDERGIWDDTVGLTPEEWANTYAEAYRRIDLLLAQGHSVIDDSVNHTWALRERLRAIAARHGASATVLYIDVPAAEARHRWVRNRQTEERGDVRDEDFANVFDNFEPPCADETVLRYAGVLPLDAWIDRVFPQQSKST